MTGRSGAPRFRRAEPGAPFSLPIRNRPFLAGSAHPSFPERIGDAGEMIPVLEADMPGDLADGLLAGAVREAVDAELPVSGGVLIRGLPLTDRPGFEKLVTALGFSGFGSIDFQKTRDGRTLLLEFNPRPTPISHLGARLGVDLAAAYRDGQARDSSALLRQSVALYPQEMLRDPSGGGIDGSWHDIPEDEPELLEALQARVAKANVALPAPA